jgi:hypothetical protein
MDDQSRRTGKRLLVAIQVNTMDYLQRASTKTQALEYYSQTLKHNEFDTKPLSYQSINTTRCHWHSICLDALDLAAKACFVLYWIWRGASVALPGSHLSMGTRRVCVKISKLDNVDKDNALT